VWESNPQGLLITRNLLILLKDVRDVGDVREGLCTNPYNFREQDRRQTQLPGPLI
jgi:hypothetical protein